jgi:metal-sulfur cluster biosynthetic enzyme
MASREQILSALEGVYDPELGRSVVELDMVRDVAVDGRVHVVIALTVPCPLRAASRSRSSRRSSPSTASRRSSSVST